MELNDKICIVTGGNKGIGKAIAGRLAREGCHLALLGRDQASLQQTARELEATGAEVFTFQGDLLQEETVADFIAAVRQRFGGLDILVNNAGVGYFAPVQQLPIEQWDAMFNLNVRAVFLLTQQALPLLRQAGQSFIVNIASLAGKNAFAGGAGYAATKHALIAFGRCLMLEERKNGVHVLTVCPGSVRTDFFQNLPDPEEALSKQILEPGDVAQIVVESLKLPERAMVSELDIRPANP